MLGVATVCFVMSMHNGFESEIRTRLLGTTSHVSIFPSQGGLIENYDVIVSQVQRMPGVVAASPFIFYKAGISSASAGDGIIIRGIEPEQENRTSEIERDIKAGEYGFSETVTHDDTLSGIMLGSGLADRLGVFLEDPVVLYSMRGEDLQKNIRPRVAKFLVTAIFETGMYEFDGQLAYISLSSAQDLFKTGNTATAVHLKLNDINAAESVAREIDSALDYEYDVVPWTVLHKNLFTWIAIEKKILFLGFTLIVIVAAFSIISTLVMLTMEKRAEIGILKTMGTTPGAIRKIFVYKGLMIAVVGVILGWTLAAIAAWVQNTYEIITLPGDIYFISYLPIDVHLMDFAIAGLVTVLICFAAAIYPADQAARMSVVDVLRQ